MRAQIRARQFAGIYMALSTEAILLCSRRSLRRSAQLQADYEHEESAMFEALYCWMEILGHPQAICAASGSSLHTEMLEEER